MKEQNVIDDLVNGADGADADEARGDVADGEGATAIKSEVLELLGQLFDNRDERREINLNAAKGKARTKLTGEVADLDAAYEKGWEGVAALIGSPLSAQLRQAWEPWRTDYSAEAPFIEALYDDVVKTLPEYPCCPCGARLVLPAEQAAGKCEACAPLTVAAITPDGAAAPVNVPLPFPIPPFDFTAALEEIFRLTRKVEASRHEYEGLKAEASDAKKQWEAAATACEQATTHYEQNYRDSLAAAKREEQLQASYVEKLEADAAAAAQPELPVEPVPVTAADRVPDLASATPLTDALPTCACGNALALDTEKATGVCDWCSDTGQR